MDQIRNPRRTAGRARWPRRAAAAAALVAAVVAGSLGPAWACLPQPIIEVMPQSFGSPGAAMTVDALRFASGPAELRWGSVDGPLLGKGTGPNFSLATTVPHMAGGLYTIVGFSRAADGSVGAEAAVAEFQITAPGGHPTSAAGGFAARPPAASDRSHWGSWALAGALGGLVGLGLGALGTRAVTARRRRQLAA